MEQKALDETVLRYVKSAAKKWRGYHRTKHKPKLDTTVSSRHLVKKQQEKEARSREAATAKMTSTTQARCALCMCVSIPSCKVA